MGRKRKRKRQLPEYGYYDIEDVESDVFSCEDLDQIVFLYDSEDERFNRENIVDRISTHPDGVAHKILSLLTVADLARFGSVSKRCRELQLSAPTFVFESYPKTNVSFTDNGMWLSTYLDMFLMRRGDSRMDRFLIRWDLTSGNEYEKARIVAWIENAARCNVEVLDLRLLLSEKTPEFLLYLLLCFEKSGLFLEHKVDSFFSMISAVPYHMRRVDVHIHKKENIKALFLEGYRPRPLDDVCYLRVNVQSLADDIIPAMVSLFRGVPYYLSALYISSKAFLLHRKKKPCASSGFKVAYWELQNLAFINYLREVTIELSGGSNGIELAAYMLKHARNLMKMVIIYSPQQSDVIKELDKIKRISYDAIVVCQENQQREMHSN